MTNELDCKPIASENSETAMNSQQFNLVDLLQSQAVDSKIDSRIDNSKNPQLAELEIVNQESASLKPGNPGWCAPPPAGFNLSTGDIYVRQETGPNSHEDVLRTTDQSELTINGQDAQFRTQDGVQIRWSDGGVRVTLPDGTEMSPQGGFSVELNGRNLMSVSYQDGQTRISQPNGHSITFDRQGILGVTSMSNGIIRHQDMRHPQKLIPQFNIGPWTGPAEPSRYGK